MKLGIFTVLFQDKPFEEVLDLVKEAGLDAVEIGCGNYPPDVHCKPAELLEDEAKLRQFKEAIDKRGLVISALSCHGNPLHPNPEVAEAHRRVQRQTFELAGKLGVERVITFSGCPGDSPNAKYPNWVTCAWPPDYQEILKWQWEEVVIPFWREEAEYAKKCGVKMICLEMHPGFVVYNPPTLLRLREAVGEIIGANFDPSHLFWQGIDPVRAVFELKDAIYHVHMKDTILHPDRVAVKGVLDTTSLAEVQERSWIFRTIGYGHDLKFWKDFVSALQEVGYDWVLSIEHEDALMSIDEGFRKAVEFLKEIAIKEKPPVAWWA